jgi:hypothetical protein
MNAPKPHRTSASGQQEMPLAESEWNRHVERERRKDANAAKWLAEHPQTIVNRLGRPDATSGIP